MIQVNDVTFGYAGKDNLFEHVSFAIDERAATALIGRNGRGKTTLLKLLAGEITDYTGRIDVPCATVRFDCGTCTEESAFVAAERYGGEPWQIEREAELLGISDLLDRELSTLSGGQRTRVHLAGLFAVDAYALIDEPTDSLDFAGRQAVARYLARKRGFLLASHDRAFLDACTCRTVAITRTGVTVTGGKVGAYLADIAAREHNERIEDARLKKEIDRMLSAARARVGNAERAEKSKYGVQASGLKADRGAVGHKAAKMMQAAKNIERQSLRAAEEKRKLLTNAERCPDLKLVPLSFRTQTLVTAADVSLRYGEKTVLSGVNFTVERGSRTAVVGSNGCGKSTLLKAIAGIGTAEVGGTLKIPNDLTVSYVGQEGIAQPLHVLCDRQQIDRSLVRALGVQVGLSAHVFDTDVTHMSLGERKKAALVLSLCSSAHLYVWDEPLNYVDIETREQIARMILAFRPTLVFVEHDAAFVDRVATARLEIKAEHSH